LIRSRGSRGKVWQARSRTEIASSTFGLTISADYSDLQRRTAAGFAGKKMQFSRDFFRALSAERSRAEKERQHRFARRKPSRQKQNQLPF
jgi:hypothetical protein